ncbi:hypothetical protein [Phytopseudomonas seleniipraecipitans]|uniref:Uncharacterized protein n=1 Tax=Phytopseudomonas seleniipraecipitans TaxID=640205 RepID=A0A1G7JEI5_9GAMM|nr:hypothetical protein [Pseudomonas seleniipraecipitans]SDF23357.1 hypothetical protein SAMN05216381_1094 [Pseudomonas seleniipraecipitans]
MHPTIQILAIGLIAGLAIGIAIHLVVSRTTKARIRAQGYSACSQARQPVIDELKHSVNAQALEIISLKGQRLNLVRDHQHALESISQDADARVKLFAHRALSENELLWVKRAITQLRPAAIAHGTLGNPQGERDALAVKVQLSAIVGRLAALAPQAVAADPTQATAGTERSVIVQGPQGCGKTLNAARIAKALGLSKIVDNWQPGDALDKQHTLYLTYHDEAKNMGFRSVMSYDEAMQHVAKQEAAA